MFTTRKRLLLLLLLCLSGCGDESLDNAEEESSAKRKKRTAENVDKGEFVGKEENAEDVKKMELLAKGWLEYSKRHHRYPTTRGQIPGEKGGEPKMESDLMSWRVFLLPFIGGAKEFSKFKPWEPWSSANNKPLADHEIRNRFVLSNGNLVCIIDTEFMPAESVKDIKDGTANTIMLLENPGLTADQWTHQRDFHAFGAVETIKSLKKGEYLLAATYDGKVVRIYSPEGKPLVDRDLFAIFGPSDGDKVYSIIFEPNSE